MLIITCRCLCGTARLFLARLFAFDQLAVGTLDSSGSLLHQGLLHVLDQLQIIS